jgi:Xaa-Pro dipeptidase
VPAPLQTLTARLARARDAAHAAGLAALLLTPSPDLRYLLGIGGESHERLTCLVLPADGDPALVVPALERPGLDGTPAVDLGLEIVECWGCGPRCLTGPRSWPRRC